MPNSFDNLAIQDAMFRQKLKQALGLEPEQEIDPESYKLILKRRRISSILKEQMQNAGFEDLAKLTRIRRET